MSAGWAPDSDAHQRRLAGAVAADEADDLAGMEVDRDVADGVDAAERDVDVAHLDERRSLARRSSVAVLRVAHEPRRRLMVSRPTATISTTPATMFWPGEFDAEEAQAVGQRLHDERAEDGARDRPDAAGERRAADDRRGDDVQLVALRRCRASRR